MFSMQGCVVEHQFMGAYNSTPESNRVFGEFLRETMEDPAHRISSHELVQILQEQDYETSPSRIDRLRAGGQKEPGALLIWRLAELKLLKKPDGEPYSHEELLLILCGQLNPLETWRLSERSGVYGMPNAAAIQFLESMMQSEHLDLRQFARDRNIPERRMRQILRGAVPNPAEFFKLAKRLTRGNPAPLIELYDLGKAVSPDKLRRGQIRE